MIVKNVEKKENNTAVFQVESDAAEFESAVNGVFPAPVGPTMAIFCPGNAVAVKSFIVCLSVSSY